jgi:zinc protease
MSNAITVKLPPPPHTLTFTLKNGLEVILAPVSDSPVVSTWMWYRVGSRNEYPGTTGAAHWLEHMLFKGSTHYAAGEIDRAIIGVGGNLNAFTDMDFTTYLAIVPKNRAEIPLRIEADRLIGATIPEEELNKERNIVLSEREMNENYPEFKMEEELFALSYRIHPYRWPTLGYEHDIRNMHSERLREFYRRFYGPGNATLVVAGGFAPSSMKATISKLFEPIQNPVSAPAVPIEEPHQRSSRETTLHGPGSTPMVKIGWHAPAIADERTPACLLMDLYLGGECPLYTPSYAWMRSRDHPSSRLYQALVDERIAVQAGSEYHTMIQPGLFAVGAKAAPGVSAERVEEALLSEVEKLAKKGISATALKELKKMLLVNASTVWSGTPMIAFRYGYFRSLGGVELERTLLERALNLKEKDISAVAVEILNRGRNLVRYIPEGS